MLLTHFHPDTCHFNKNTFGYIPSCVDICLKCKKDGHCEYSHGKCQCFICRITLKKPGPYETRIFYISVLTINFKIFNKIKISSYLGINYNQLHDVQKHSTQIVQHNVYYKEIVSRISECYQKYLLLKLIKIDQDDVTNYLQNILFLVTNSYYFKLISIRY